MRLKLFLGAVAVGASALLVTADESKPQHATPATAPATSPSTRPSEKVQQLITQISQGDWRSRDKAALELVRIGEEAIPALEQLARTATFDEARTTATTALKQIAENRLTGPSYVTLHLKDVSAKKAFAELEKQAFATLKPFPDNLWSQRLANVKVTIDLDRQPFWVAMRELGIQTGLELRNFNGEQRLMDAEAAGKGPYAVCGAFLVVPNQITRSQTIDLQQNNAPADDEFGIQFTAYAEPKLRVLGSSASVKLDKVTDDQGNSLVPPLNPDEINDFSGPIYGSDAIYPLYARLLYPKQNAGKKISRFRASTTFTVQIESEKLDVPVKTLKGSTRSVKGVQITFGDLTKVGETWQLKVIVGTSEDSPAWEELQNGIMTRLKLVDSRGQALDHHGFGSNVANSAVEATVTFGQSHRPEDGRQSTEPVRLLWEIPTRTQMLNVPFEFTDLKLP